MVERVGRSTIWRQQYAKLIHLDLATINIKNNLKNYG